MLSLKLLSDGHVKPDTFFKVYIMKYVSLLVST